MSEEELIIEKFVPMTDEEFEKALDGVLERHKDTLRRLAEYDQSDSDKLPEKEEK